MSEDNQISNSLDIVKQLRSLPELKPIKPRQRRFILAFAKTFSITAAAEISGIPWVNHYSWLKKSAEYKQAFEFAKEMATDYAEADVYDRAFIGKEISKTRIRDGEAITEKYKQKSDILAMFMLKGLKPQYRDNFNVANVQGPISVNFTFASNSEKDVTPKRDLDMTNEDK